MKTLFKKYNTKPYFINKQKPSAFIPNLSSHSLIQINPATVRTPRDNIPHICGLGASVGCERLSEYSTRRD